MTEVAWTAITIFLQVVLLVGTHKVCLGSIYILDYRELYLSLLPQLIHYIYISLHYVIRPRTLARETPPTSVSNFKFSCKKPIFHYILRVTLLAYIAVSLSTMPVGNDTSTPGPSAPHTAPIPDYAIEYPALTPIGNSTENLAPPPGFTPATAGFGSPTFDGTPIYNTSEFTPTTEHEVSNLAQHLYDQSESDKEVEPPPPFTFDPDAFEFDDLPEDLTTDRQLDSHQPTLEDVAAAVAAEHEHDQQENELLDESEYAEQEEYMATSSAEGYRMPYRAAITSKIIPALTHIAKLFALTKNIDTSLVTLCMQLRIIPTQNVYGTWRISCYALQQETLKQFQLHQQLAQIQVQNSSNLVMPMLFFCQSLWLF